MVAPLTDPVNTPLQKADYETLAAFRYALRQFLHFSEEAVGAAGLSPQQHQALLAIKGYPERDYVSIGELAERLQIRHHSAVGLVDRLVADGFVVRQSDPDDRRKVCVALTAHGEQSLESLSTTHREELRRVAPKLTEILNRLTSAQNCNGASAE
jgi:DNA-binding MarR family transcriptional regulator